MKRLITFLISALTAFTAGAQTQYFNISGTQSVNLNCVTAYTYSGPCECLSWSVTGGIFTSSNTNTDQVSVIWTSTSGTLSASGTEISDCFWDDASYPPVWTCTYTPLASNAFNVSGTPLTVSGETNVCNGSNASLSLPGYTGTVVRWEKDTGSGWTTISSTSTTLEHAVTANTQFRALVTQGACSVYTSSKSVIADLSGKTVVSNPVNATVSAALSVTGNTGSVIRWEKNDAGSWVNTGITTATYPFAGITKTTQYRAAVKLGSCTEIYSGALTASLHILVYGGGPVTLTAPSGTSRQWYKNGTSISGQTGAMLDASEPAAYTVSVDGNMTGLYFVHPAISNYTQGVNAISSTVIRKAGVTDQTNLYTLSPSEISQSVSYQDALGQTFQTIAVGGSPGRKDIIAPVGIGKNGLADTTYLPYVSAAGDGKYRPYALKNASNSYAASEQYQFYQGTAQVATDSFPFARTTYRSSPDARVTEQRAPGKSWQTSTGKPVKSAIGYNDQDVYKLRKWNANGQTSGYYASNTAVVSISTDENSNQVRTYTNGRGLSVLKEVQYDGTIMDGVPVLAATGSNGTGVASEKIAANTDGYVEVSYNSSLNQSAAIGLDKTGSSLETSPNFDYALYKTVGGQLHYRENSGTGVALGVTPVVGSRIRIEKSGTSIYYKYSTDGNTYTTLRTVSTTQTDHYIKADVMSTGRQLDDVRFVNATQPALSPVSWASTSANASIQVNNGTNYGTVGWLQTYSIYDDFGRLIYQLPPKALAVLGTGTTLDANNSTVAELIYKYSYDSRGRLVEKKVPGAATEFIVYDQYDRVVLTQDGNLRGANKWMFIKYDIYNRPVYSGIYLNTTQTTRSAVQALLDALDYNTVPWYESEEINSTYHGYSNSAFPTSGTTLTAVHYYDHYNFDRSANGSADYSLVTNQQYGQETTAQATPRGMSTGSETVMMDATGAFTSTWLKQVVFYGKFDRPIQTQSNNHLYNTVADISTIVYDFTGQVLRSTSVHFKDASTSVKLNDSTLYDHAGRVTHRYRRMDNEAAFQLVSQYEYNALGQLVDKKLHKDGSGNFVQSIDYRYTIRGWLKSINNSQLSSDNGVSNDETNDLFGEELLYNTVQSGLSNTPLYNGNITAVMWKTASMGQATQEATNGQRAYKYTYDKSDKMLSATFAAHDNGTSWNKQVNTLNESATYDHNGNILSLVRYQNNRSLSGTVVGSAAKVLDNLVYTHATGNQLTKVEDRSGNTEGFKNVNTTTEYTYNVAGSQTKDDNKGISSIAYNVMGKPLTVNFTSGKKVEYIYDASGGKRTVKVYQGATLETTTDYSGGFVYESGTLSFFSSPEGRVVKNGSNYEYQYAIADHQGNTRVMFSGTTPAPTAITATFEGGGSDNANLFSSVDASKVVPFTAANHTASGSKVIKMNQTYAAGPAKSIKVYPGDRIDAEVWSYHENNSGFGSGHASVAAMVTAVATAFGGASGGGGESGSIYDGVNTALGGFGLGNDPGDGAPAAYLNYIQFDQQYKVLNFGFKKVKATRYTLDSVRFYDIRIKEPGYIFVYLSYEDESNNWVYFDDFKVTHTKSNIVQANEYYPFGMQTASSWTRENATDNKFLANGGTELNRTTGNYDLEFRNYDPVLARMNQVDPMAAKYASQTPYNYSFNNPVSLNDPNGADPYNHSPGTSFHGGYYTYDDIVPNKYPDAMAYSGRQGVMGVAGWGGYGRSGIFDGFNALVNSTIQTNNARERLANNIVNGIASALAGEDGTYVVNPITGSVTNIGSDKTTMVFTALEYHNSTGTLGTLALFTNYQATTKREDPQGPKREGFEGGKLYAIEDIGDALMDMMHASRKIDGDYLENAGIFTNEGLLVLPNAGNSPTGISGSMIYLNKIISKDHSTLTHDGRSLSVLGMLHTHPDPAFKAQGHSDLPRWSTEWKFADRQVGSFVLSPFNLYHAIGGDSKEIGDPFRGDRDFVLRYIRKLYK